MSDQVSPLYAEILGETAKISWQELQPYFARGLTLWVASDENLIAVAEAIVADNKELINQLMQHQRIAKLNDQQAQDYYQRDPELWATVVSPWVLVQERPNHH